MQFIFRFVAINVTWSLYHKVRFLGWLVNLANLKHPRLNGLRAIFRPSPMQVYLLAWTQRICHFPVQRPWRLTCKRAPLGVLVLRWDGVKCITDKLLFWSSRKWSCFCPTKPWSKVNGSVFHCYFNDMLSRYYHAPTQVCAQLVTACTCYIHRGTQQHTNMQMIKNGSLQCTLKYFTKSMS